MPEKEVDINQIESLSNVLEVVEYLTARGWKIKKSSAYQHVKEKKLQHKADGTFSIADVEMYARKYLKRLDGTSVKKSIDNMMERKYNAETESAEFDARIKRIKAEAIEGKYVLREIFEDEIAAQALAFRNSIQTYIHAQAEEIVSFVGGDVSRIPDLLERMMDSADNHFLKCAEALEAQNPLINVDLAQELSKDENDENESPDDDE
jgi:hypothetical protein